MPPERVGGGTVYMPEKVYSQQPLSNTSNIRPAVGGVYNPPPRTGAPVQNVSGKFLILGAILVGVFFLPTLFKGKRK
jgi:hypothetical protein